MNEVDLQKTVDANAERGVAFTLKPAPQGSGSPASGTPAGPAPNQQAPAANPQQ